MEVILALFFIWYMINTLSLEPPMKMFFTVLFIVLIIVVAFPPMFGHPLFGPYRQ